MAKRTNSKAKRTRKPNEVSPSAGVTLAALGPARLTNQSRRPTLIRLSGPSGRHATCNRSGAPFCSRPVWRKLICCSLPRPAARSNYANLARLRSFEASRLRSQWRQLAQPGEPSKPFGPARRATRLVAPRPRARVHSSKSTGGRAAGSAPFVAAELAERRPN